MIMASAKHVLQGLFATEMGSTLHAKNASQESLRHALACVHAKRVSQGPTPAAEAGLLVIYVQGALMGSLMVLMMLAIA